MRFLACISLGILVSMPAQAAAIDALRDFVRATRSGRAPFTQVIINKAGKSSNPVSGTFVFQRPGKFRWTYEKPYDQAIVGDGERLWIHDRDLNQVTVRRMDGALGQSPAAILSGSDELEKNFDLKNSGTRDGLEWLEAVPKSRDTTFEVVRIGLKVEGGAATIAVMELKDTFGQTSVLTFGRMERNPALTPEAFRFTPPKGADVIGADK
ncbi:MAG: outer membrane lipoprotein chaperone LolA [Burkholderiales bacterium]